MQILLNIEDFSNPIIHETRKGRFVTSKAGFFKRFLFSFLNHVRKKLNSHIGNLIVALEGYMPHIDDLSPDNAERELLLLNKVAKDIYKLTELFQKVNYFDDAEIKEKYIYAIKLLNTTESKLHKSVYKSKPRLKTPIEIIEGVSKMNANNMDKLLAV